MIISLRSGNQPCRNFFNEIKKTFIYKRFRNIDDLKTQMLNSLIPFLDDKGEFNKGPFDKAVCKNIGYDAIDEKKVVKRENSALHPTNAALLFFGKDPSEHISHHEIRIACFNRQYRELFKVTNKTAATDLALLVKVGMVQTMGKGRNVKYKAG